MKPTFGSFFSGGDLAGVGAMIAGYELVFGVEYDAQIAEVYRRNLGDHIIVADVRDVDIDALPLVDLFHASPVCTNASVANNKRGEQQLDIETAKATAEYIRRKLPRAVTIENVMQYRQFEAYRLIIKTLDECGYWYNAEVLNSADFGVPQTRRRLIVRAIRGGWVPSLPPPVRWVGWYEAIEDLIPTLPDDKFADWQIARLPEEMQTFLMTGGGNTNKNDAEPGRGVCFAHEPSLTVTTGENGGYNPRAFIIGGQKSASSSGLQIVDEGNPHQTVTATVSRHPSRAWLSSGRVVRMTTRCLARFQSVPDWYELPESNRLAGKIIGNGVPCLMYKAVAASLLP